jgi:hypothetical protein
MAEVRIRIMVHGNAVVPQFSGGGVITSPGPLLQVNGVPWSDVNGLRQGPGIIFRGKGGGNPSPNFFHVSIPSPNPYPIRFTADQRDPTDPLSTSHFYGSRPADLVNVVFQHSTDPGVILEKVFAFDGSNLISVQNFTGGSGVVPVTRHTITAGLGVSFQVNFTREGNITFNAVGADFLLGSLP